MNIISFNRSEKETDETNGFPKLFEVCWYCIREKQTFGEETNGFPKLFKVCWYSSLQFPLFRATEFESQPDPFLFSFSSRSPCCTATVK